MCLSFLAGIFNEPVLQPILASMAAAALPAIKCYTPPVEQLLGDGFQFARKSKRGAGHAIRPQKWGQAGNCLLHFGVKVLSFRFRPQFWVHGI